MACISCGAETSATARFCPQCGTPLDPPCPACGRRGPPGSRLCEGCGGLLAAPRPGAPAPKELTPRPLAERILAGRAALEGERKQVTVLFADTVGSTALSDRLDPEETYDLMRRCLDLMLEQVHRYEGTVTQFLGDGILALFGAPLAHEDHAQRAVHAALGIQHALQEVERAVQAGLGLQFRMRIGLNSGLVVVRTIGSDLSMTYTAIGTR